MKTPSFEPVKFRDRWILDVPASCSETGKRRRLYFDTFEDAKCEGKNYRDKIKQDGRALFLLDGLQAEDARKALALLKEAGQEDFSLTEVTRDFVRRHQSDKTLGQVWGAFINAKPRSEKYTRTMNRTGDILHDLHEKPIGTVSVGDLEDALAPFAHSYQAAMTREIRAVFSWAVRRGYCNENPAKRLLYTEVRKRLEERTIISPAELGKILNLCLKPENPAKPYEHHLIAPLAILFFAGVRPFELLRLTWRDIDLEEGMIDLPAKITKRGRRRSIEIEPALAAWLRKHIELCGPQHGQISRWRIDTLKRHRDKLLQRAKVKWEQNIARHSYASYWLAKNGDLNKLALHMGHTGGLEVLHRHYYRCVRQAEAEAFWNILPPKDDDVASGMSEREEAA